MLKIAKKRTLTGDLQDTNIVQKARPLSLIRSVPFSYGELRILDTYLSRIDSHDPEHRTVTFTKAEYEELMGIGKVNLATFRKYTKGMLGKVVDVPMPEGYLQFVLFTKAQCEKDEYGVPTVTLTCTDEAKRLFFEIEQLGYVRYELQFALALKKQASYWLYLEVLRERYRTEWTVPLPKLRDDILHLKKEQSYKQFKEFKRAILDPAVAEINKRTDCCLEYETVKRGRSVVAVTFRYIPRELDQVSFEDLPLPALEPEYANDTVAFMADACENEFSPAEMEEIVAALLNVPARKLPEDDDGSGLMGRRFRFLLEAYARTKARAKKDRKKYLLAILQNER